MTKAQVGDLPCSEIVDEDGEYIATLIVPCLEGGATIYEHTRTQTEYLGVQSNSVYVEKTPFEEALEIVEMTCDCGFEAKSPFGLSVHQRKHLVKV